MTTISADLSDSVRYTTGPATFDARSMILDLLGKGLKTTQIRDQVRKAGFKIRNQTVTDILKESRIINVNRDKLAHLSHGSPRNMVSQTVTDFETRYMYHGEGVLSIVRGGVVGTRFTREIQKGYEDLVSAEQAREKFFDIMQKGFEDPVYYKPLMPDEDLNDWFFEISYFIILWHLKILSILET